MASPSLPRRDFLKQLAIASTASLAPSLLASRLRAADAAPEAAAGSLGTLYCVGYAHLDTEWRWSYPIVIREFLRKTMEDNFPLLEKYPDYIFNFTGANRYRLMKEYFPQHYATMTSYIKAGRWFPAGSSWEEGIVDEPSSESIVRHVLYGNQFFRREFGVTSNEYMLPDSFGFPASLPTLLAHSGLKGFSTQKLSWGSAVGIPFNVGIWKGPDGRGIIAALNATDYTGKLKSDLSDDKEWTDRMKQNVERTGVAMDYRYWGTGDRGGAPEEDSVKWLETSLKGGGPLKIVSAKGSDMFDALSPEQIAKLPTYTGDLLLTQHSSGTPSAQAFMKKLNRKNEFRADEAERAAVLASHVGALEYPIELLSEGWKMVLAGQFHDILAGTCKPDAYGYAWNDGFIARNKLTQVRDASIAALSNGLDTKGEGIPLLVYNPLSAARTDVVEASITFPSGTPEFAELSSENETVQARLLGTDPGGRGRYAFLATVPPMSVSVYHAKPISAPPASTELSVSTTSLRNRRYEVAINAAGDVAGIKDLKTGKELLAEPARLAFLREDPDHYPAWNMNFDDATRAPFAYVDGEPRITIVENGPARVALRIERMAQGSRIVQTLRLAAGEASNRLEFYTEIDWRTRDAALKAVFPLTASNPKATYNWETGTIERETDNPKAFEWPSRQWFDLTDASGSHGVSVLEDCKYGSDKPADNTLRLTLMFTPGGKRAASYHDQMSMDFGRHDFTYALVGHSGDWREAGTPWEAARLNQPLVAFQAEAHDGPLGSSVSLLGVDSSQVILKAVKRAEESDEIIVRVQELHGKPTGPVLVSALGGIASAREVDGQEREVGPAALRNGALVVEMGGYGLRAFALTLNGSSKRVAGPVSLSVPLPYNTRITSIPGEISKSRMDTTGRAFPAESYPRNLALNGITYGFGPNVKSNAMAMGGQTLSIPDGTWDRLYLLAASNGGREPVTVQVDGTPFTFEVQPWTGNIGQPDYRLWNTTDVPEITYDWDGAFVGVAPGFLCKDPIAWQISHRHSPEGKIEFYDYAYMFRYAVPLPVGAKLVSFPDAKRVMVFAASVASGTGDSTVAVSPDLGVT